MNSRHLICGTIACAVAVPAGAAVDYGNLWPLGDSITWGDAWTGGIGYGTDTPIPGGYRTELYKRLTTNGSTVTFTGTLNSNPSTVLTAAHQTAEDGLPGFDSQNIAAELNGYNQKNPDDPGYWLEGTAGQPAINPNLAVIMAGTNDLLEGVSAASMTSPGPDSDILNQLFATRPGAQVYLCELLPITDTDPKITGLPYATQQVPVFNSYLPYVVNSYRAMGYNITLVDPYDAFLNPDGTPNASLLFDGVHPNQTGYNLLGDVIANGILGVQSVPRATTAVQVFSGSLGLVQHGKGLPYIIDVGSGGLIDHNGSISAVTASIQNADSTDDYQGLVSSTAFADPTHLTTVGSLLNTGPDGSAIYSTFDNQSVTATDVLGKYTYFGDANLDGKVDGSDYTLIDNGYNNHLTGWYNGDFNYDGIVDGSDYTLIDNAFNTQQESLGSNPKAIVAGVTSQLASVPEPMPIFIVASSFLLMRRRRGFNRSI